MDLTKKEVKKAIVEGYSDWKLGTPRSNLALVAGRLNNSAPCFPGSDDLKWIGSVEALLHNQTLPIYSA
jgi:hypothetical protein